MLPHVAPYTLNGDDIIRRRVTVSETMGYSPTRVILTNLGDETTSSTALKQLLNKEMVSADTEGGPDSGMHALLGRPTAKGELFCKNARNLVTESFRIDMHRPLPYTERIENLTEQWWTELVEMRDVEERQNPENIFLSIAKDELNTESQKVGRFWAEENREPKKKCLEHVNRLKERSRHFRGVRQHLQHGCNEFFTRDIEEEVIRPLARRLNLIPSTDDIFTMTAHAKMLESQNNRNSWLAEAYTKKKFQMRVKGNSGVVFPENGPDCKYTALFSANRCFDPLRRSFVEDVGARTIIVDLEKMLAREDASESASRRVKIFLIYLRFVQASCPPHPHPPPPKFSSLLLRQWCMYPGYLSVEEILLFAEVNNIHVVIVAENELTGSVQSIWQTTTTHQGAKFIALLFKGNIGNSSALRGNFERLFLREEIETAFGISTEAMSRVPKCRARLLEKERFPNATPEWKENSRTAWAAMSFWLPIQCTLHILSFKKVTFYESSQASTHCERIQREHRCRRMVENQKIAETIAYQEYEEELIIAWNRWVNIPGFRFFGRESEYIRELLAEASSSCSSCE